MEEVGLEAFRRSDRGPAWRALILSAQVTSVTLVQQTWPSVHSEMCWKNQSSGAEFHGQ